MFDAWHVPVPRSLPLCPSEADLLRLIATDARDIRPVHVTKHRRSGVVDGCQVEVANVTFDDMALDTIAIEMSDPDRLWTTVQALGLAGLENVNYVNALKRYAIAHPH
ncbi:MAG: hypothetical protein QM736_09030 [Vicinamibacterales bacterium]